MLKVLTFAGLLASLVATSAMAQGVVDRTGMAAGDLSTYFVTPTGGTKTQLNALGQQILNNATGITNENSRATTAEGTKAPLASPTFTGTVTIPTESVTGNSTIGGTLSVTGTITAAAPAAGDNSSKVATTSFVSSAISAANSFSSSTNLSNNPITPSSSAASGSIALIVYNLQNAINNTLPLSGGTLTGALSTANVSVGGTLGVTGATTLTTVSTTGVTNTGNESVTGTASVGGTLTVASFASFSTATGLTAAGSSITNALTISKAFNTLTSVPSGSGAILSASIPVGSFVTIYNNDSANTALIYPPNDSSSQIENKGTGTGISLVSGGVVRLFHESANQWRVS